MFYSNNNKNPFSSAIKKAFFVFFVGEKKANQEWSFMNCFSGIYIILSIWG